MIAFYVDGKKARDGRCLEHLGQVGAWKQAWKQPRATKDSKKDVGDPRVCLCYPCLPFAGASAGLAVSSEVHVHFAYGDMCCAKHGSWSM